MNFSDPFAAREEVYSYNLEKKKKDSDTPIEEKGGLYYTSADGVVIQAFANSVSKTEKSAKEFLARHPYAALLEDYMEKAFSEFLRENNLYTGDGLAVEVSIDVAIESLSKNIFTHDKEEGVNFIIDFKARKRYL